MVYLFHVPKTYLNVLIHSTTINYVHHRIIRPGRRLLHHHHVLLGFLGQHPEARFVEMALRAFLLGLRYRYRAAGAVAGAYFR